MSVVLLAQSKIHYKLSKFNVEGTELRIIAKNKATLAPSGLGTYDDVLKESVFFKASIKILYKFFVYISSDDTTSYKSVQY